MVLETFWWHYWFTDAAGSGIGSSTMSPTQARFAKARVGGTRFSYYEPSPYVVINGTNRATYVLMDSLHVEDRVNLPKTASFVMKSGAVPAPGQSLVIALGNETDYTREFGGYITRVEMRHDHATLTPFYTVTALDYVQRLDKRAVSFAYENFTATGIATHLIDNFTDLSRAHVEPNLPTIASFSLINERPSSALTRLCELIGAVWYVDEHADLHLFQNEDVPDPPTLTSTTKFWDLSLDQDASQIRNRVIVEGKRTTCALSMSEGFNHLGSINLIPLESSDGFQTGTAVTNGYARIGTQPIAYSQLLVTGAESGENAPGTTVRVAAAAGDGSLAVASVQWWQDLVTAHGGAPLFVRVGDQILRFVSVDATPGSELLQDVGLGGVGAITAPIAVGTPVTPLDTMVTTDELFAHPVGTEVVLRAIAEDAGSQATIAALEGGDGVREALVSDSALDYAGAAARAAGELDALSEIVETVHYKTRHVSAKSGRTQAINLGSPTSINRDFVIQAVDVDGFEATSRRTSHRQDAFPIRTVTAGSVRLGGVLDQLAHGEDTR